GRRGGLQGRDPRARLGLRLRGRPQHRRSLRPAPPEADRRAVRAQRHPDGPPRRDPLRRQRGLSRPAPRSWKPGGVRLLATVRARTVLGASLALGIALLLSASTAGALLRRSLIRSIDEVAEVRAADVAALANRGELAEALMSQDSGIVQVVSSDGRVVATSLRSAAAQPLSSLLPPPGKFRTETVDQLHGGVGADDKYRILALRGSGTADPPVVYVATGLDAVEHNVAVISRFVVF